MNKAFVFAAGILSTYAVMSVADVVNPNAVMFFGDSAKEIVEKVIEVTGQEPREVRGRKIISANAQVSCNVGQSQFCTLTILK